jgi:hypothetical protein
MTRVFLHYFWEFVLLMPFLNKICYFSRFRDFCGCWYNVLILKVKIAVCFIQILSQNTNMEDNQDNLAVRPLKYVKLVKIWSNFSTGQFLFLKHFLI